MVSEPPLAEARAFDRAMMEALLAHSSSGPAREAAAAWLAAFEAARAVGAQDAEAAVRADEAWRRAAQRVHLDVRPTSRFVARVGLTQTRAKVES